MLTGYKTYIAAAMTIVGAFSAWYAGADTLQHAHHSRRSRRSRDVPSQRHYHRSQQVGDAMKRILAILALSALAGCGTLTSLVSSDTVLDAKTGAKTIITGYADIYQPFVLTYGHWPKCGVPVVTGAPADSAAGLTVAAPLLCHDPHVLAMLKAVDKAATAAIVAAKRVLDGTMPDTGQIEAVMAAIQSAELQINASGINKGTN